MIVTRFVWASILVRCIQLTVSSLLYKCLVLEEETGAGLVILPESFGHAQYVGVIQEASIHHMRVAPFEVAHDAD